MTNQIRVLIADDHPVIIEGLRLLMSGNSAIQIVGTATDGDEAVLKARALEPDVLLLDLMMPCKGGIDIIPLIREESPHTGILVLTAYADDDHILAALQGGALGYLLKNATGAELTAAIYAIHKGEPVLNPAIARKLLNYIGPHNQPVHTRDILTEREIEVLKLVAHGMSNQEIADDLVISERTVRTHVSSILSKLGIENRTQAALYAIRHGLITVENILSA